MVVQFGAEPYRVVDTGEAVVVEVNAGPDAMGQKVWLPVVPMGPTRVEAALDTLARTLAASKEFRAMVEGVAAKQKATPGQNC